jgi:hypothetical protein
MWPTGILGPLGSNDGARPRSMLRFFGASNPMKSPASSKQATKTQISCRRSSQASDPGACRSSKQRLSIITQNSVALPPSRSCCTRPINPLGATASLVFDQLTCFPAPAAPVKLQQSLHLSKLGNTHKDRVLPRTRRVNSSADRDTAD